MKKLYVLAALIVSGLMILMAAAPQLMTSTQETPLTTATQITSHAAEELAKEQASPIQQVKALNIHSLPPETSSHYQDDPTTPRPEYVLQAPSLSGTNIDGSFNVDSENNLVLNLDVRDTFDYFLNTIGEVSSETAIKEIKSLITAQLPEPAQTQAITALEDYLTYKAAALEILNRPLTSPEQQTQTYQYQILKNSLSQLRQLQEQYLSPEMNQAFYQEENAFADYTLKSMEIQLNESLSLEEKTQALMLLEEELPEQLQFAMNEISQSQQVAQKAEQLYQSGNREAYQAHLQANYSEDVVQASMDDFDRQQTFESSYQTYQAALKQYDVSDMDETEIQALQEDLRTQYFEGHDLLIAKTRDDLIQTTQEQTNQSLTN